MIMDGFAGTILDVEETGNFCSVCNYPICSVTIRITSGEQTGKTHTITSCVNKECDESQKNIMISPEKDPTVFN